MKEKRIIMILGGVFLIIMITFTYISRFTVENRLPLVETMFPKTDLVVPYSAVFTNEKGNTCIYTVRYENTFLGLQPVTDRIPVTIVDEKTNGVQLSGIDINFGIIIDSERDLEDGERIRKNDG